MSYASINVMQHELSLNRTTCAVLGVISFIGLTVAGAYLRIPLPFTPVPITLQTFFVVLAGACMGRRLGLYSQLGYLLIGIFGLPVFTGGLYGFARLFGPTGGYLLGFILAAYAVGFFLSRDSQAGFVKIASAMLAGLVILFTTGTVWLGILMHLSPWQAMTMGVLPFVPGEIIKLFSAAAIYQGLQKPARNLFGAK